MNATLVRDQLVLMQRFEFKRRHEVVNATCRRCGLVWIASPENIRDGLVMQLIAHAEAEG